MTVHVINNLKKYPGTYILYVNVQLMYYVHHFSTILPVKCVCTEAEGQIDR